jgi:cell division protein FtsB
MNPTLISGFEDVITHIKQQEHRVMGLEEENKKLKAEVNDLNKEVNRRVVIEDIADLFGCVDEEDNFDWESEIDDLILDNAKLKEEINKLKEENEKLKKKLRASVEEEEGEEWNGWYGED